MRLHFFRLFLAVFVLTCLAGSSFARQSSETKPAAQTAKRASSAPGIVIYNAKNGHYYQSFEGSYTWTEAYKKAAEHTFGGVQGHLATITTQEEYDFVVGSLFVYDYWIGGYRDSTQLTTPPNYGWRWVTGEPWGYVKWNDNEPANKEAVQHVLSFWTGSMKWSKHVTTDKTKGYVVEYPTTRPVDTMPLTPSEAIDDFTKSTSKTYQKITTYQATVEFTFKAFVDTLQNVRATLMMQSDGRFRLDGRGENGKLLAISDGKRLMLSLIEPGERMKFVVKPMPSLTQALKEAFSLLTSSPKPPSIIGLITGSFDRKLFSAKGIVGEYIEGDTPEQRLHTKATIRMPGEDPMEGNVSLSVDLNQKVFTRSDLEFRFKAYPYSVRETHSNIKINEPIPGNNFVLVITTNAKQVDDLGEDDDIDITYSAPGTKK